ncbi:hypothetical protein [Chitinophaga sp. XS-30]|nr:hypothetical protein [Chitinophaga sp. XS-30]
MKKAGIGIVVLAVTAAAPAYHIRTVPRNFLVGPDSKIIAKIRMAKR